MNGKLYVFSGPSGAGKSTLIRRLREKVKDLGYSVSHTSRTPRTNETDGIDYHFVERDSFAKMIKEGSFAEWATVYGDFYGTSFSGLRDQMAKGIDVILDVDYQGARNIKAHFKESVLIYILPPSFKILEKRLKERATDDDDVIDARLKLAKDELQNCGFYDYIIFNDDLEEAVRDAESIVNADRCSTARVLPRAKEIFLF
jgi:guanylate kinase